MRKLLTIVTVFFAAMLAFPANVVAGNKKELTIYEKPFDRPHVVGFLIARCLLIKGKKYNKDFAFKWGNAPKYDTIYLKQDPRYKEDVELGKACIRRALDIYESTLAHMGWKDYANKKHLLKPCKKSARQVACARNVSSN